jgi:NarL family two-component system response regulator YdfI
VDIIVAAFQPEVRAALHRRLQAGERGAALEIDSPAGLARAPAEFTAPIVLAGVSWAETAPFLAGGRRQQIPVALLLEGECLDARHAAFRGGAAALLPWALSGAGLAHALESVGYGLRVLPWRPSAAADAERAGAAASLSPRERELLELVAAGLGNKAMARRLGLSVNTVKYHLASIFTKLDARTRAEAVSAAARRGELML